MGANDERGDEIFHQNVELPSFSHCSRLSSPAHLGRWLRQKRRSGNYSQFRQDKTASYPIQSKRQQSKIMGKGANNDEEKLAP